jgi:hypothetical protein
LRNGLRGGWIEIWVDPDDAPEQIPQEFNDPRLWHLHGMKDQ